MVAGRYVVCLVVAHTEKRHADMWAKSSSSIPASPAIRLTRRFRPHAHMPVDRCHARSVGASDGEVAADSYSRFFSPRLRSLPNRNSPPPDAKGCAPICWRYLHLRRWCHGCRGRHRTRLTPPPRAPASSPSPIMSSCQGSQGTLIKEQPHPCDRIGELASALRQSSRLVRLRLLL
jgi:hypothetical protein